MKPSLLIIVTDDPRTSPRPAEAVRLAAGIGTWQRTEISLYFRGEAVRALGQIPGVLLDEEGYAIYWPMLSQSRRPIYAQQDAPALRDLGPPAAPFKTISDQDLADLAAKQNCVLRF